MLIVMHKGATEEQVQKVCKHLENAGLTPHPIPGATRVSIGVTGNKAQIESDQLSMMPGVFELIQVTKPYKLTSREMKPEDTIVDINGVKVGGGEVIVIGGPCAVESPEQTMSVARSVKQQGGHMLRGGAFKPRSSPYAFQGLGKEGLEILKAAREETGLPVVTEAVDTDSFGMVEEYSDVIQIGARNMQNYALLKRAGQSKRAVILKRGFAATVTEFLLAAEYIMAGGNYNVILCERGIRTFSNHSRFTLDLSTIPELKRITHLPVIVDPSHAAGRRDMVMPLARAAVACGADGLIVEVHNSPETALCDGPQALTPELFTVLMRDVPRLAAIVRGYEAQ